MTQLIRKGYSFPVDLRILRRREFLAIYKSGKKLFTRNLVIVLLKSECEKSRLGITISRKIDKRAVRRNRFKRRIRELFRLNYHQLANPLDIVVTARREAAECPYDELKQQFLGALKRYGYLIREQEQDSEKSPD